MGKPNKPFSKSNTTKRQFKSYAGVTATIIALLGALRVMGVAVGPELETSIVAMANGVVPIVSWALANFFGDKDE